MDGCLQLIIIDFMNFTMFRSIAPYENAKRMWYHIEVLCEGTEEVRENIKHILVSQYEAFMDNPKKEIIEMF